MNLDVTTSLKQSYGHYDWFHSVGEDQYRCTVLYVKYLNAEVLNLTLNLPRDVKIHFAGSLEATLTQYANVIPSPVEPVVSNEPDPINVRSELFDLSRICGRDNLVDIFYEVHDGPNAVSSISNDYPSARQGMQVLYDAVGFDILFEELDGDDS